MKAATGPMAKTHDPYHVDWAEVAARARAALGDESVTRVSDRLRMTMMATAGALRPGDTAGRPFGTPAPGAWDDPGLPARQDQSRV